MQTTGLQSYFLPYSFSPLIDNGTIADAGGVVDNQIAPLNRRAGPGLALDQIGIPFTGAVDIGGVELRNAPDPMHVTLLTDEFIEGSIRGAELYYNTHYPADTLTFDPALRGQEILLDSNLAFELLLDPNGAPVNPSGVRLKKFLFSDATDITLTRSLEYRNNESILSFVTPVLLSGMTIDGFNTSNEFHDDRCLLVDSQSYGSELNGLIIRGCSIGAELESDSLLFTKTYIYQNRDAGLVVDLINNDNEKFLKVVDNVIGLDENLSKPSSPNHVLAGVGFNSRRVVLGGLENDEGNVIAGNDGAGIFFIGEENDILGNYIGVLKDGTTVIPNRTGISLATDSGDSTFNNIIEGNTIVGNEVGIRIPGQLPNIDPSSPDSLIDNDFYFNTFSANDTAIFIEPVGYHGSIVAPSAVTVQDSVVKGIVEPQAFVHVYLDSTDNGSFIVDTVNANNLGEFEIDLKTYSGLPAYENVTAMQYVRGKGSSELSRPVKIDCSELKDSLKFGEIEGVCVDGLNPTVEIVVPFKREGATFQWFSDAFSSVGFEQEDTQGEGDTITFNTPNDFRFFTRMTLEDGCVITSDTVLQRVGIDGQDFIGFEITEDSLEVTPPSQTEFLAVISNSPVDSIVWSSDIFTFVDASSERPTLTSFGTGFIYSDLVSPANCVLKDSLYVTYLGEPVAVDDEYTILLGSFEVLDVLENDINTNDTSLTIISAVTSNINSFASIFNNKIEYAPESAGGSLEQDTITYIIQDGYGKVDTAEVFLTIVEFLDPSVTISVNQSAVCSNDSLEIFFFAENFNNPDDLTVVWTNEGGTIEDILDANGNNIGVIFIPGFDAGAQISVTVSDLDTVLSDSIEITVFSADNLSDFALTFDNNLTSGGVLYEEEGQVIFGCDRVVPTFVAGSGNTISGIPSIVASSQSVKFTVSNNLGICTEMRSFKVVINENIDTTIALRAETGNNSVSNFTVELAGITDFLILESNLVYGTVSKEDGLIKYVSLTDTVGVVDTVKIATTDACGSMDTISYAVQLKNTVPEIIRPNYTAVEVIQKFNDVVTISRDSLAKDKNNNHNKINIINPGSFDYLSFEIITSGGIDVGIIVKVVGEIPENVQSAEVNYEVCDFEACSPGVLTLLFVDPNDNEFVDLDIVGGVIQDPDTRELLKIIPTNTAVTNNVPLAFRFEWNGERINANELEFDLVIISRWGDVVYQDQISGEKVKWNGEYQLASSSIKVPEGNYSWVLRVFFENKNGNRRAESKSGILYYSDIESVNTIEAD